MENRRSFLKAMGICLVATNIARPLTALAAAQGSRPASFDAAQWRCAAAICAELIPSDDTPGAAEAGCVNFIDKALAAEDAAAMPLYRAALAAVDAVCMADYGQPFAELDGVRRNEVMQRMEQGNLDGWSVAFARPQDFFATIRFHTLLGFIADPKYGGNRDYAGWKLMGFPGPMHQIGGVTPAQMRGSEPVVPLWESVAAPSHAGHHGKG